MTYLILNRYHRVHEQFLKVAFECGNPACLSSRVCCLVIQQISLRDNSRFHVAAFMFLSHAMNSSKSYELKSCLIL
jgi:hypothetical protein